MIDDLKIIGRNAYAAGIIDGEGCFGIYGEKNLSGKFTRYDLRVVVQMTNLDCLTWLKDNFGGKLWTCPPREDKNEKQVYRWFITSETDITLFIEKIYRYLIIKKPQAINMLNYINRSSYDGSEYYKEMRRLNKRGREGFIPTEVTT